MSSDGLGFKISLLGLNPVTSGTLFKDLGDLLREVAVEAHLPGVATRRGHGNLSRDGSQPGRGVCSATVSKRKCRGHVAVLPGKEGGTPAVRSHGGHQESTAGGAEGPAAPPKQNSQCPRF